MCTGVKEVGMKEGKKYVGCVYLFVWEEGQGRGREECGWRAGGRAAKQHSTNSTQKAPIMS